MIRGVLLAIPGDGEAQLITLLDAPRSPVRVTRRCADTSEIVAAALAGLGQIAVLATAMAGIDRPLVRRLQDNGVHVVLLADAADRERWGTLGADTVLDADGGVTTWAETVREVAGQLTSTGTGTAAGGTTHAPDPATRLGTARGDPLPAAASPSGTGHAPTGPGAVIAVWGPRGAPGRTTVAMNLAAELARLSDGCLLIDADTEAPSLARALGILTESAGVAAVARQAAQGRLTVERMGDHWLALDGCLRVLTGMSRPDRWRELTPAALDEIWQVARQTMTWTVVDVAAGLEDGGAGFEVGLGARRSQATEAALRGADVLVVVGLGDPIGMPRLVHALNELEELLSNAGGSVPRHVVVNRVRSSVAGSPARSAVQEALSRFAGLAPAAVVPEDQAAVDRALLRGATLLEAAPSSPARYAINDLAHLIAGQRRRSRPRRFARPWRRGSVSASH